MTNEDTQLALALHEVRVDVVRGRYPYRPACSCGWTYRGFVAEHAASDLAAAHERGEL